MPTKRNRSLSIVVPAFNEEERLRVTLPHLCKNVRRRFSDYEIIVVDDGSTDDTSAIVKEAGNDDEHVRLVSYRNNMGKGYAVRTGVLAARKDNIVFCDADLSTPFREINKLLKAIDNGSDIAIGSRARKETRILKRQPLYRILMGKTFNKIVQVLAVPGINDTQCGFKCFKAAVAIDIFEDCQINGFSFDVEVLYIAKKEGFASKRLVFCGKTMK